MAFEFVGDVADIVEVQFNLIREALKKKGYEGGKVTVEAVGKVGDNYVANVKRATIEDGNGAFSLILKVAPKVEMMRMMTNSVVVFNNETIMYTQVLPKLVELQKSVGTPEEDLLKYPVCYGVLNEAPNELIILEDLKIAKYEMKDRLQSLSDKDIRLMMKNLGLLHSLGFVLKEKEPELYGNVSKNLVNVWQIFANIDMLKFGLDEAEANLIELLDSDLLKDVTKGKLVDVWTGVNEFTNQEQKSPHLCIIQGDCWTNNIMFRNNDGKPECIMIDYQQSRLTSPVIDLIYFIFNCTDHATRKNHYFEWLDLYYSIFSETLTKFGLNPKDVYSRINLHKDIKYYAKYLYGLLVFFLNVSSRESSESFDFKAEMGENMQEELEKIEELLKVDKLQNSTLIRLKTRMTDLAQSFVEYGYL